MELINLKEFDVDYREYSDLEIRLPTHNYPSDFTGDVINNNTVIGFAGILGRNQACMWLCRCSCGIYHLVSGGLLTRNKSCKKCSAKNRRCKWADLA